jgi:hypothetical protein
MQNISKSGVTLVVLAVIALLLVSTARAQEDYQPSATGSGYTFGLAVTLGEQVYFIDSDAFRGPVSLELVPSFGWPLLKLDLGLYTTFESVQIGSSSVGHWNFTFRPGARLTPTLIPLYIRFAIPLILLKDDTDFGLMFGAGLDFQLGGIIGLVFEVDTTLSKNLEWGGNGVPLEFRAGLSFHY